MPKATDPDEIFSDDLTTKDIPGIDEDSNILKGDGESVVEKPTMDGFFSYDLELQTIDKTMRGFSPRDGVWVYTSKPLADDEFISGMINSLKSIIRQGAYLVSLEEEEVNTILMEKNYEFAGTVYLDSSIDDDDAERIINIHDHMLELFLKSTRDGIGNSTVRQMSANLYKQEDPQAKKAIVNWEALGISKK